MRKKILILIGMIAMICAFIVASVTNMDENPSDETMTNITVDKDDNNDEHSVFTDEEIGTN